MSTEQAFCSDYGHHGRKRCHVCGLPNPESEQAFCSHRWHASRVEVDTAPVEHVCGEAQHHEGEHRCSCGARR